MSVIATYRDKQGVLIEIIDIAPADTPGFLRCLTTHGKMLVLYPERDNFRLLEEPRQPKYEQDCCPFCGQHYDEHDDSLCHRTAEVNAS